MRTRLLTAIVTAVALLAVTACIPARAGRRCSTTEFGSQGDWVLQCRNGRWVRLVTNRQVAELYLTMVAQAQRTPPVRVIVGGDSTGTSIANALIRYAARHPWVIEVVDASIPACAVTIAESTRNWDGLEPYNTVHCGRWRAEVPQKVQQLRPEAAIVVYSLMEQADQRGSATSPWRNVLDPEWAAHQRSFYHQYADQLSATGATIFWADVAVMAVWIPFAPWVVDHSPRTAALNASYRQFASERTDVELLPLAARIGEPFTPTDAARRPDGIHLSDAAADAEVANWLVPMLLERFR